MTTHEQHSQRLEERVLKKPVALAIWSVAITFLICLGIALIIALLNVGNFGAIADLDKASALGDTINGLTGPVIAFLVAILTFLAFFIQYKANTIQNKANELLQIENKFFQLLSIHKSNVSETAYIKYDFNQEEKVESHNRKVFRLIFKEFTECFQETNRFADISEIKDFYLPEFAERVEMIYAANALKPDLIQIATIDIAYNAVFYGVGAEGSMVLKSTFSKKYKPEFYLPLLSYLKLKPKQERPGPFSDWLRLQALENTQFKSTLHRLYQYGKPGHDIKLNEEENELRANLKLNKYYGGHQHRLGHYFRHLFQSYTFINNQPVDDNEKYFYGKTLRAQLSTYEQALLFINSISTLGWKWELNTEAESGTTVEAMPRCKLISKFNIIKNLPGDHFYHIYFKHYYPNVKFDSDDV